MSDANQARPTTVSVTGVAVARQRPAVLVMTVPLRAAEATLELGLAKLKRQYEATAGWLRRLNAGRVEFGEPHFADQAPKDPVQAARAAAARRLGKPTGKPAGPSPPVVCVVATATWDVAAMSAEEVLVFVDRLRFEVAPDAAAAEPPEPPPPWADPQEQLQNLMTQMVAPPAADPTPQILFVSRLTDDRRAEACAAAMAQARRMAEGLARAAGLRLGRLASLHWGPGPVRHDRLMDQQRCLALLADSTYDRQDDEIVSDDPRAAEFTVGVSATYHLE